MFYFSFFIIIFRHISGILWGGLFCFLCFCHFFVFYFLLLYCCSFSVFFVLFLSFELFLLKCRIIVAFHLFFVLSCHSFVSLLENFSCNIVLIHVSLLKLLTHFSREFLDVDKADVDMLMKTLKTKHKITVISGL